MSMWALSFQSDIRTPKAFIWVDETDWGFNVDAAATVCHKWAVKMTLKWQSRYFKLTLRMFFCFSFLTGFEDWFLGRTDNSCRYLPGFGGLCFVFVFFKLIFFFQIGDIHSVSVSLCKRLLMVQFGPRWPFQLLSKCSWVNLCLAQVPPSLARVLN